MPANLPPEYLEAEERYRSASTDDEKLAALEEMLSLLPNHKGTDKIEADLRKRISSLKDKSKKKKGPTRAKTPDQIEPEGAGQVVLAGFPNTGKSTLLDVMTNASPKVADFPFSTHGPTIGMARFEDVQIQLIDTPPLSEEHVETWVYNLLRKAHLLLVLVDASSEDPCLQFRKTQEHLQAEGIHLFSPGEDFQKDPIGRTNKEAQLVISKSDEMSSPALEEELAELSGLPTASVSILLEDTLERFPEFVFDGLGKIRVYTKKPGEDPDLDEPYLLDEGSTALEAVRSIHRNLVEKLDYIRIWGSGKYDGQEVSRDHCLEDGDIIEIHQK